MRESWSWLKPVSLELGGSEVRSGLEGGGGEDGGSSLSESEECVDSEVTDESEDS
jgi:hypothetical protein